MAISATDASDRVEQLIVLTERLTGLIAEEALAFRTAPPAGRRQEPGRDLQARQPLSARDRPGSAPIPPWWRARRWSSAPA